MFYYYIKIAFRNLMKNKMVSSVNILGLSLGLFCTLFALTYAIHEYSYESSHENADNIALVYLNANLGGLDQLPMTCGPEGPRLKDEYQEIQDFARARNIEKVVVKFDDELFLENDVTVAEQSYFEFFTFDFINGVPPKEPYSLAISESLSRKYFNSTQVLGKVINIRTYGDAFDMKITGVFKDLPSNTHLASEMVIPFDFAKNLDWDYDTYNNTAYSSYVWLDEDVDLPALNRKIKETFDISQIQIKDISAELIPVKDIHLFGDVAHVNFAKMLIFLITSIIVLLVSCFNYINLSTATMVERSKEIGIKKVIGANKRRLVFQFVIEAGFVTVFAFGLAFILLELCLPMINQFLERDIQIMLTDIPTMSAILGLLAVTVALSGAYPAFYLSGINPTNLFNKSSRSGLYRKATFRKSMVVAQFVFTILFIQCITILNRQFSHLDDQDVTGFNTENIFCLSGYAWGSLEKVESVLSEKSSIQHVVMASSLPASSMSLTNDWKNPENKDQAILLRCSYDFPELFQIKIKAGRFFSRDFKSDHKNSVVINQQMADALELKDPIGETMFCKDKDVEIVGVIDDYMATPPIFNSFPMIITLQTWGNNYLLIRYQNGQLKEAETAVQAGLAKLNPGYPVDIEDINDVYAEDSKEFVSAGEIFIIITSIAIVNVIIGLFGLSIFLADRRKKEIGIRKTFGASIFSLMRLMTGNFLFMFLIAFIIASPITYLIGGQFLNVFTEKIDLSADIYLLGGGWAILITLISVCWKLYISANRNPVDTLRYE